MSSPMTRELNLSTLVLRHGSHRNADDGMCVMEAVSYVAGEIFSDAPQCACPVIAAFARALNDRLTPTARAQLVPFIPRLVGSKGPAEDQQRRAYMCADWAVRTVTVRALRAAGLSSAADTVAALAPVTNRDTAAAATAAAKVAGEAAEYAKAYAAAWAAEKAAWAAVAAEKASKAARAGEEASKAAKAVWAAGEAAAALVFLSELLNDAGRP